MQKNVLGLLSKLRGDCKSTDLFTQQVEDVGLVKLLSGVKHLQINKL